MSDDLDQTLHVLDDVDAPDQWNQITARAAGPHVHELEADGGHPRSRLVLAAAVIAVLIIGVGLLVGLDDGESSEIRIGEDPATLPTDPPEQIWGRVWIIQSIRAGDIGVPGTIPDQSFLPVSATGTLDLSTRGQVGFGGCNTMSSPGSVYEGQLRVAGIWRSTLMACDGGPKANLDETVTAILERRPTIDLHGDRLTLVAGDSRIELEDRGSVIERGAPHQLWGRRWELYDYPTGTGSMLAPTARPSILDLTEVGRFSFTSCDTYEGKIAIERDRLVATDVVVTTDRECDDTRGWESANAEVDRIVIEILQTGPLIDVAWYLENGDRLGLVAESPGGRIVGVLNFHLMLDED